MANPKKRVNKMNQNNHHYLPVLLITGAAGGIGKHFALAQRNNFRMVVCDLDKAILDEIFGRETEEFLPIALDVADAEQWQLVLKTVLKKFDSIDIVINNAGVLRPKFILAADASHVMQHLDVNAGGLMLGTILSAQAMKARHSGGHIININSMAGIAPVPGLTFYAASKFAARGFSLSAALELKAHGIAVSSICPDAVRTPMYDLQLNTPQEAALTFSGARTPLEPVDVEKAILEAIRTKAVEIILPAHRGWLSKLASAWPQLAGLLHKNLSAKGLKRALALKNKY